MLTITADAIVAQYATPAGYDPGTNHNWIGLWPGATVPYGTPPQARTQISSSASTGTAVMKGVQILRDMTYSLGYFMSEAQTTLAATLTFNV